MIGKEIILDMVGTKYDGNRAMIMEEDSTGFMKVQILEYKNFGKKLVITKYQIKD